jgi:hypothetical protein
VPHSVQFTPDDIRRLFELLNAELASSDASGEVYLVGGAVMCLVFGARAATRDIDAYFRPTRLVREAASRVASSAGVPDSWLNDAVKSFLSPRGEFDPWLELSHLRIFTARPEYLLAMKCASMRLGAEFHDLDDVRYLLRYLNVTSVEDALGIITRYFEPDRLHPKSRLALEELLPAAEK